MSTNTLPGERLLSGIGAQTRRALSHTGEMDLYEVAASLLMAMERNTVKVILWLNNGDHTSGTLINIILKEEFLLDEDNGESEPRPIKWQSVRSITLTSNITN